jgi:hypothetical protein
MTNEQHAVLCDRLIGALGILVVIGFWMGWL